MPWPGPTLSQPATQALQTIAVSMNSPQDINLVPRFPAYIPALASFNPTNPKQPRRIVPKPDGKRHVQSVAKKSTTASSLTVNQLRRGNGKKGARPEAEGDEIISCFSEFEVSAVPVTLTDNGESVPVFNDDD